MRQKLAFGLLCCAISVSADRGLAGDLVVLYALDRDLVAFKAKAEGVGNTVVNVGGRSVNRVNCGGRKVYLCKMESGAMATGLSATAVLSKFPCEVVIVIGPAGALSDEVKVGQWFRVTQAVAYQKGMATPDSFALSPSATMPLAEPVKGSTVPELFAKAPEWTVATGEVFVAATDFRNQLAEQTKAQAVEMNLFGVAMACAQAKVPLLCWRVISDHADEQAGADFKKFVETYDGAGGQAVAEYIQSLPPDRTAPETYPALKKLLGK